MFGLGFEGFTTRGGGYLGGIFVGKVSVPHYMPSAV